MITAQKNQPLPDTLFADISIIRGDSVNELVIWSDSTNTPIDFTGMIGSCQIRVNADDASAVSAFDVSLDNLGNMRLTANATEMAGLADGNYVYDVQVDIISTGYRHTYISGNLIALPDVTR